MLAVALTMAALVLASQQDICGAQLSIHTDSSTNSFSLKTPGLQQTFTRYYGAPRQQPQTQVQVQEAEQPQQVQQQALLQQQQQQQEQLIQQYRLSRLRAASKPKIESSFLPAAQQENQQQEQLQQQQLQQQQLQQNLLAGTGTGAGFFDYQRQRAEFEQQQQQQLQQQQLQQQQQQQQLQQQQFLQNFYNYNPASQIPTQFQSQVQAQQQQQQQHPAEGFQALFQRPQFASNGLQPGGSAVSAPQSSVGAGDFYTSQQQLGFMQQQQQQFATNQVTPTNRQSLGLPAPMSSTPSVPTFQPSSDVSHVSFSSGNLKYNF